MILLDTNVVSELLKGSDADPAVSEWFSRLEPKSIYLTTITLAELWSGLAIMPEGRRQRDLSAAVARVLAEVFTADRILDFDAKAAPLYAVAYAARVRQGLGVRGKAMDLQIAAIALSRGFVVATRDLEDFSGCGVPLIDPWEPAP